MFLWSPHGTASFEGSGVNFSVYISECIRYCYTNLRLIKLPLSGTVYPLLADLCLWDS